MAELEALLPELEAAAAEESRRASWERAERQRLAERGDAIATLRRDLEVRATGVEQRRALLSRRLAEVERRLEGNVAEREKAERRRAQLLAKAEAVARLRSFVEQRLSTLEQVLGEPEGTAPGRDRDAAGRLGGPREPAPGTLGRRARPAGAARADLPGRARGVAGAGPAGGADRDGAPGARLRAGRRWGRPSAPRSRRARARPAGPGSWSGSCG